MSKMESRPRADVKVLSLTYFGSLSYDLDIGSLHVNNKDAFRYTMTCCVDAARSSQRQSSSTDKEIYSWTALFGLMYPIRC
jgi:hypothetical protein